MAARPRSHAEFPGQGQMLVHRSDNSVCDRRNRLALSTLKAVQIAVNAITGKLDWGLCLG